MRGLLCLPSSTKHKYHMYLLYIYEASTSRTYVTVEARLLKEVELDPKVVLGLYLLLYIHHYWCDQLWLLSG